MIDQEPPESGEEGQDESSKGRRKRKNIVEQTLDYLREFFEFKINAHTRRSYYRRNHSKDEPFISFETADLNSVWLELNTTADIKVGKETISTIVFNKQTLFFNPIADYLKSLPSRTGDSAIRRLAKSIDLAKGDYKLQYGSAEINYNEAFHILLKRWSVSCVACGLGNNPNHICLVLIGGQRKYKTTWLNALCPKEVSDYRFIGHIEPKANEGETPNYMAEKWFINIDDQLEVIFGREFNSLKAIITMPEVTNRKPYMAQGEKRDRIANFMASVNSTNFLTDTENRRYLCFEVDMCHPNRMPNMDDVWAEAYQMYRENEQYWFTADEYTLINTMNEDYAEITSEQEWLQLCFRPATTDDYNGNRVELLTASEIRKKLQEVSNDKTLNGNKLGRALKRLNYPLVSSRLPDIGPRKVYAVVSKPQDGMPRRSPNPDRDFDPFA